MKILSIETTTNFGSIALLEYNNLKKEILFESSDIAGEIIEKLNIIYEDFDYVVVSAGPGSWTGIRIGISFAKGLVLADKSKIYVVNVFDSIFYSVKDIKEKFIGIVYSSRDMFFYSEFNGRFNYKNSFKIKKITLKNLLLKIEREDCFLIGPGVINLKEFKNIEKIKTIDYLWYPRASLNGMVAYQKIKRNIPSLLPEPIYGK
ncbi:MAG TPA: tRNA (adenosine(37)-N6)-threonylcarbamoyltransferase complex dimerization subunit type 1 TsaB [bacterium]|nr:tRNA (adenosine(37)-N6)-threonylcarbamoyltransferase complex dimerization subunit type 1 TsaB [bacterium]HOM25910.1 tRNA (adenosine(37)-N6)-threonylcarbamoyltransferase complex dimerization subunit type 1 TsaB [bacterium]